LKKGRIHVTQNTTMTQVQLNLKTDVKNLPYEKLKNYLVAQGEKPFRAPQIMKWIFQKGVGSFSEMTDLSQKSRESLEKQCEVSFLKISQRQLSLDGTQKFLFELSDKNTIESVYIPDVGRVTLCVSTQVGCRMGCKFCLTAQQGLIRNLKPSEIVNQLLEVQKKVERKITNIVMMGMGEPLDNIEAVLDAIDILRSKWAFNISGRKITVSTVGLAPKILQFGKSSDVNLAISLNASNDHVRSSIMPMNKKYDMDELLEACKQYPLKPNRRLTIEYVMLGGVNDSLEHAKELVQRLQGVKCKVNLIPFNEHPGSAFKRPTDDAVSIFQEYLNSQDTTAMVRKSRGRDILAACGQLCSAPSSLTSPTTNVMNNDVVSGVSVH